MIHRYATRFPPWFTYEVVASTYILLRTLLFEGQPREKLKAIWRGSLDGLRERMGQMPGSPEADQAALANRGNPAPL
jgi:hypothetical protein